MELGLAALAAWVLGGIPFGLVLVRVFRGVDIRSIGSGNVGATNASRAFGGSARIVVFLLIYVLDFLKGLVPTLWFPFWFGLADGDGALLIQVVLGALAVVGHCASPFLGLRGGKGVATTTGVFAALEPVALGIALGVFFGILGATRQVFLGSLAIGVTLPVVVVARDLDSAFADRLPVTVLAIAVGVFLFWTHRSNLRKFRAERTGGASA